MLARGLVEVSRLMGRERCMHPAGEGTGKRENRPPSRVPPPCLPGMPTTDIQIIPFVTFLLFQVRRRLSARAFTGMSMLTFPL